MEAVRLSTLLSLGTALISLGIDQLREGSVYVGALCVAVGFGLILVGVYLFEKGVVERVGGCVRRR